MHDGMKRASRQAFTLVELLVVMAIIAVLAALVFPAVGIMRTKAKNARCMNNAKQIALAANLLFQENKEVLPARSDPTHWGEAAEQLLPFVRNMVEIFDCPANQGLAGNSASVTLPNHAGKVTDYEMNGYLCSKSGSGAFTRRQNGITDYSKAAYAYDTPYTEGASPHEGGVNVAYLDGHAGWLRYEDMGTLPDQPSDNGTFVDWGHTFW